MPAILKVALLSCVAFAMVESRPVIFRPASERSWLWSWTWGGAQSTVSVVDRSPVLSFASRPAAFGAEINDPILGYVIPLNSFTVPCNTTEELNPNFGCPELCINGEHQPEPTETWIALVQRGKCEFAAKVREAQRLGARAVVVGGSDPDIIGYPDTLVNMFSPEDASDLSIASTFIKWSDYTSLSQLISSSNTTHAGLRTLSLLITAEYSAWEWYSPIVTFFVILILPSLITFITLFVHRVRAARAARRERAPEDVVRNLPWSVWTGKGIEKHYDGPPPSEEPSDSPEESADPSTSQASPETQPWFETQVECAICLSDFAVGDKIRILPCHHVFHLEEVDEWLIQRKKLCPICKCDVTTRNGEDENAPNDDDVEAQPTDDSADDTERTPLLSQTGTSAPS